MRSEQWSLARGAYRHPPASLSPCTTGRAVFSWWKVELEVNLPCPDDIRQWTGVHRTDEHHANLLQSREPDRQLAGFCSVVFWTGVRVDKKTICTSSAISRLRQLRDGRKDRQPQSLSEITQLLGVMREQLQQKDVAAALATGLRIKLAGLPLASRLLTFMAPDLALPYDSVTSQGLLASKAGNRLYFPVLTITASARKRQLAAYEEWCQHGAEVARQLRKEEATWLDWDLSPRPFRAIDVQRAYEALGHRQHRGLSSVPLAPSLLLRPKGGVVLLRRGADAGG